MKFLTELTPSDLVMNWALFIGSLHIIVNNYFFEYFFLTMV